MGKPNEKLRTLRGNKTQAEVAKAVGITASAYAMYERGERVPRDTVKKKLADYFHRSVTFIFFSD